MNNAEQESLEWLDQLARGDDRAWARFYSLYDPVITAITGWTRWSFDDDTRREVGQRIRWQLTRVIKSCPREGSITWFIKQVCTRQCLVFLREREPAAAEQLVPPDVELDDEVLVPLLEQMVEDGVHDERPEKPGPGRSSSWSPAAIKRLALVTGILVAVPALVVGGLLLRDRLAQAGSTAQTTTVSDGLIVIDGEPATAFANHFMLFRNALEAALVTQVEDLVDEPGQLGRVHIDFVMTPDERMIMELQWFEPERTEPRREWSMVFGTTQEFKDKLRPFAGKMASDLLTPPPLPPEIFPVPPTGG